MFSPNPEKAQEPVFMPPGNSYLLNFKTAAVQDGRIETSTIKSTTVLLLKAVRWKSSNGPVMVAFNHDPRKGLPEKYFLTSEGEFLLNDKMASVCFTNNARDSKATVISVELM